MLSAEAINRNRSCNWDRNSFLGHQAQSLALDLLQLLVHFLHQAINNSLVVNVQTGEGERRDPGHGDDGQKVTHGS